MGCRENRARGKGEGGQGNLTTVLLCIGCETEFPALCPLSPPWSRQIPTVPVSAEQRGEPGLSPQVLVPQQKGSLVLCCPPWPCPALGQEASCYPHSPGSDLITIKWKHLESHMMDKVCTTCLWRGSFMLEISCVMN